jgi:hypothetical protein
MKCAVCGKDLGFWAKLGKHTQICKTCREQGQNRLKVLANSVGWLTNWHQEQADRWLAQYDEIVHKYQVPTADALRARNEILNGIFKLVESQQQQQLADADLEYLVGQGQRYDIARSGSPELQDTVLRIALRQAIQSWDREKPLERECTTLVLSKGEVCHWEEPAGLLVRRTKREYVGGYGSVSIPLHIVRGARVRVGGFKGVPIDKTVHEDGGRGYLHITNQRVCFTGLNQAVAIPFKKIVSLAGFDEGFEVHTGNEKKPGIFLVPHPELTAELLKRASSSQGDDDSRTKRRRKAPSPTLAVWVVLLSAVTLVAGQNAPSSGDSDKSLGDIARKVRPKDAKVTTKHVFTDDDVAHGTEADTTTKPLSNVKSSLSDAQDVIDRAANQNSRELGEAVVGDIRFPGRDAWEDKLYQQRLKLVNAAQTVVDYAANKLDKAKTEVEQAAAKKGLDQLLFTLSVERTAYNRISAEGISQAAAWEKRSR